MKNEIDNLFKDKHIVFNEDDVKLSTTSLNIALKAYFDTYHCVKQNFHDICSYNDNPQHDDYEESFSLIFY
ncbi:MAG: hypothetical protein EA343_18150 [Nodularia sp. (in: Bacteria)]|nr:MAG: hypothetical protein EA343_18150 [Nodularia sp. (in: cyanobacteria)]